MQYFIISLPAHPKSRKNTFNTVHLSANSIVI
jgi:hypothetical protein